MELTQEQQRALKVLMSTNKDDIKVKVNDYFKDEYDRIDEIAGEIAEFIQDLCSLDKDNSDDIFNIARELTDLVDERNALKRDIESYKGFLIVLGLI